MGGGPRCRGPGRPHANCRELPGRPSVMGAAGFGGARRQGGTPHPSMCAVSKSPGCTKHVPSSRAQAAPKHDHPPSRGRAMCPSHSRLSGTSSLLLPTLPRPTVRLWHADTRPRPPPTPTHPPHHHHTHGDTHAQPPSLLQVPHCLCLCTRKPPRTCVRAQALAGPAPAHPPWPGRWAGRGRCCRRAAWQGPCPSQAACSP